MPENHFSNALAFEKEKGITVKWKLIEYGNNLGHRTWQFLVHHGSVETHSIVKKVLQAFALQLIDKEVKFKIF